MFSFPSPFHGEGATMPVRTDVSSGRALVGADEAAVVPSPKGEG